MRLYLDLNLERAAMHDESGELDPNTNSYPLDELAVADALARVGAYLAEYGLGILPYVFLDQNGNALGTVIMR